MDKIQKVFIAGGTGFLGYAAAELFLERGVKVDSIALAGEFDSLSFVDKRMGLVVGNLFEMSDEQLYQLFKDKNYDAIVYALGPDDRVTPKAPAYEFFYERLVNKCYNILNAAKKAGAKKAVILSSYFAHFDKLLSGKLSKKHAYIRARREQQNKCFGLSDDRFKVCALELPYIFGVQEGRKPIWKDSFLSYFDGFKSVYFPSGGATAIIDRTGVAEAIYACTINGEGKTAYPIATDNISYKEMLKLMLLGLNDNRKVVTIPGALCALGTYSMLKKHKKEGKESGLYYPSLMNGILNKEFTIDAKKSMDALGFEALNLTGGKDARQSIKDTMKALV